MEEKRYEWKSVSADVPIRQGDLLAILDPKTKVVEKMVVVITADCDLAQEKFGSQVACLSMEFHDDYVRHTWSQKQLTTTKSKAIEQARDKLRACLRSKNGSEIDLSAEAAESWIVREDSRKIALSLAVADADFKSFDRLIGPRHRALRKLSELTDKCAFDQLRAFNAEVSGLSIQQAGTAILKKAHDDKIPTDVFLIPGFPGDVDRPALVFLRGLVGISPEFIATRPSGVASTGHFLRVGRLRSTFKYALSQAFGALYSKIGFPVAYETRRSANLKGTLSYEWK